MKKETIKLEAKTRGEKENIKELIAQGSIPAILYGAHLDKNVPMSINRILMEKVFERAGESTLIDLTLDGKESEKKVLIKDIQKDPVKGRVIHADLFEVDMKKPIHTVIGLNFIGESNAVKNMGGSLIMNMDQIEVKCLPGDLVNHIDIDISKLNEFGDSITIADVNIPEGMEVQHEDDAVVAIVVEPKEEKEETPAPESEETEGGEEDKKEDKEDNGEKAEDKKEN